MLCALIIWWFYASNILLGCRECWIFNVMCVYLLFIFKSVYFCFHFSSFLFSAIIQRQKNLNWPVPCVLYLNGKIMILKSKSSLRVMKNRKILSHGLKIKIQVMFVKFFIVIVLIFKALFSVDNLFQVLNILTMKITNFKIH